MTGFAFPEILVRIMRHWHAGEHDAAADVFYKAVPLMRFEFQEGIGMAIRKEVLRRRGVLRSAATRGPAGALDAPTRQSLDRVLAWVTAQKGMEWISV
jgi:4-hydroxy-tetrahydrodipicolinate synthase